MRRDRWGHEYHPTDEHGHYLRAGDADWRLDRGGVMLINDNVIAWRKEGDQINTRRGIATVTQVNCAGCYYDISINGQHDRVTFSQVERLN